MLTGDYCSTVPNKPMQSRIAVYTLGKKDSENFQNSWNLLQKIAPSSLGLEGTAEGKRYEE